MISNSYRIGIAANSQTQESARASLQGLFIEHENGEIAADQQIAIDKERQFVAYKGRRMRLLLPQERKRINQLLSAAGWQRLSTTKWTIPTLRQLSQYQPALVIGKQDKTQQQAGPLCVASDLLQALRNAGDHPGLTPDAHVGLTSQGEFVLYQAETMVKQADITRVKQLLTALLPAIKLPDARQVSTPQLLRHYLEKITHQEQGTAADQQTAVHLPAAATANKAGPAPTPQAAAKPAAEETSAQYAKIIKKRSAYPSATAQPAQPSVRDLISRFEPRG
jgi:hypothetical protein